jgi:hypothetical protein
MANDKIYPIDMNSKDILLQNEGGGGMIMNDQFIGIVGNMLPDQKKLLDSQENINGTNIQTDKFSSNIIITNATSNPISINDLASKNLDTLDQSINTNQVAAPLSNDHCGGEGLLNYEYQEIAKNSYNIIELYTAPDSTDFYQPINDNYIKNGVISPNCLTKYVKTEEQFKTLLFSPESIDVLKTSLILDGSNFPIIYKTLQTDLPSDVKYNYENVFVHDKTNKLNHKSIYLNYDFKNNITGQTENRSILDIQTLPSGLRSLVFGTVQTSWENTHYVEGILVAIGPDYLNSLPGIGIKKDEYGSLHFRDKNQNYLFYKFRYIYFEILSIYNSNKTKFLTTLANVYKEAVKSHFFSISETTTNKIRIQQQILGIDTSLAIALKYIDCPNEYEINNDLSTTKSSEAPAPPSITPTVTPPASSTLIPPQTKAEEEEGIYEAEFLPATENTTQVLTGGNENDEEDTKKILTYIAQGRITISKIKTDGSNTSKKYNLQTADLTEISKYVSFADTVQKDWNNGIINPNLIKDIASACKTAGVNCVITTAKTGHSTTTTSGNISRHTNGTGVDIAFVNGISSINATNINNIDINFKTAGDKLKNALVQMGYKWNTEKGNDKAVLWLTTTGGNHYNHLHVSNRIQ